MSTYNGSKIPVVGKCQWTLAHTNNSFKVSFIVVDSDSAPILGLKTSKHLQLIKRICRIETNKEMFFSEFHDCFGEIGTLNTTNHIEVKDNVKPVVNPFRKVPHALKPKLAKELKHLQLPTAKEIFLQISNACCFLNPDAYSRYWQIKVDEES